MQTLQISFTERIRALEKLIQKVRSQGKKWLEGDREKELTLRRLTPEDLEAILDQGLTPFEKEHLRGFHVAKEDGKRIPLREAIYDRLRADGDPSLPTFLGEMRRIYGKIGRRREPSTAKFQ